MQSYLFQIKTGSATDRSPAPFAEHEAHLVLAFGSPELLTDEDRFLKLKERFPNAEIAGCTTVGEIFQGEFHEESLSCAAIKFDSTRCRTAWRRHDPDFWDKASLLGAEIASELAAPDLRMILLFVDGLGLEIDGFLEGMHRAFGEHKPLIFGGAAGDYYSFVETSVWCREGLLRSGVVAVGLYGDGLEWSSAISDSFTAASPVMRVTKSQGNLVQEINHTPALTTFMKALDQKVFREIPGAIYDYPLLLETEAGEPLVPRSLIATDEATGEMRFVGAIPEGPCRIVDFTDNYDFLRGARRATENAKKECTGEFGLFVSCGGRRVGLGIATDTEMREAAEAFPPGLPSLGFYSYGEICHCPASGKSEHYNHTFTVLFLREIHT